MPDSNPLWIDAGLDESLGNASISAGSDELALVDHGLADGDLVTFTGQTGGGTVLATDGVYSVVNADDVNDTFQVSTFTGGTPVDFTSNGSADVFRYRPAYDARDYRRAISGILQTGRTTGVDPIHSHPFGPREGVLSPADGNVVSVSGTDWVTTDVVAVVYPGISSQSGGYVVAHPSETAALDPADGAQDRIDALDLQVQDEFEDSSGFRRARIVYVPGSPGSGDRGTVTPNSLELGRITVFSGGAPLPDPSNTAPITTARGGVIPVADSNQYPAGNRYPGMVLWDKTTNQLVVDTTGQGDWITLAGTSGFRFGGGQTVRVAGNPAGGADTTSEFNPDNFPGARGAFVKTQAAGGAGGGAQATGSGEASAGTGAQGGGYAEAWLTWAQIQSEASGGGGTITITAASSPQGSSGGNGPNGGTSSFGSLVSAGGGEGGVSMLNSAAARAEGGANSTQALNGDLVVGGGGGDKAIADGASFMTGGGQGGDSILGTGGGGTRHGQAGDAGSGFGGGGGGAGNTGNDPDRPGGNGAPGIVIVEIYY